MQVNTRLSSLTSASSATATQAVPLHVRQALRYCLRPLSRLSKEYESDVGHGDLAFSIAPPAL